MKHTKTIVITGASSGAGRATALLLASDGYRLVLAARNTKALEELADECRELGAAVLVVTTDVTDTEAVKHLANEAAAWNDGIDVWVNNAGVLAAGVFEETPWEVHERVIATNLMGYMRGAHAVLPFFKAQGHGILINNISIGGFLPVPFGGAYSAAKFALRGFFEALKGELTGWPAIHVADLFPAFLDSPGIQHAGNYTGKVLKPAPPVYDTSVVARAVQASILHPRATRYPGIASRFFKLGHAIAPLLVVKATAMVMKTYFKTADSTAVTPGNLFDTVDYGMSVNGNARPRLTPVTKKKLAAGAALAIIGLAATVLFNKSSKV
ncbi:SDR family oxidoreductase [Deminuibacter soli]|uniref:Short chain dehydrogenase n=1 Tax=Deminuibacter soli TaxID=2291815 RepID=A0A3E1NGB9_9BACT|nr:SDR family oxidoreductase [Deminuibacter soli]RFM26881.1 short chain dehydrogenase [Deminuibacter soli]